MQLVQGGSTLDLFTQICPQFSREYFTVKHSIYYVVFPPVYRSFPCYIPHVHCTIFVNDRQHGSIECEIDDCVFETKLEVEKVAYEKS